VLERAGLRLEVRQREALYREGRHEDKLIYAITVDEWRGRSREVNQ
jgi:RimJ/RimL family protein N-acetyltransferase